jgi:hypothetical protein
VHEFAHAWDTHYSRFIAWQKYTGGHTVGSIPGLWPGATPWMNGYEESRTLGTFARLQPAGYFYGDKLVARLEFQCVEDFAKCVAMCWLRTKQRSSGMPKRRSLCNEKWGRGWLWCVDNWADYTKYFYPKTEITQNQTLAVYR